MYFDHAHSCGFSTWVYLEETCTSVVIVDHVFTVIKVYYFAKKIYFYQFVVYI